MYDACNDTWLIDSMVNAMFLLVNAMWVPPCSTGLRPFNNHNLVRGSIAGFAKPNNILYIIYHRLIDLWHFGTDDCADTPEMYSTLVQMCSCTHPMTKIGLSWWCLQNLHCSCLESLRNSFWFILHLSHIIGLWRPYIEMVLHICDYTPNTFTTVHCVDYLDSGLVSSVHSVFLVTQPQTGQDGELQKYLSRRPKLITCLCISFSNMDKLGVIKCKDSFHFLP